MDPSSEDRAATIRMLRSAGATATMLEAVSVADTIRHLQAGEADAAVIEYQLPDGNALDVMRECRSAGIDTPVIILTSHGDEETAVMTLKAGAYDYVVKESATPESLRRSMDTSMRVRRAEENAERADSHRRESELRFRIMADSAPVLIWMSEPDRKSVV